MKRNPDDAMARERLFRCPPLALLGSLGMMVVASAVTAQTTNMWIAAAGAWTNPDDSIRVALSAHVFRDDTGAAAEAALRLADTWELAGENVTQAFLLDRLLRSGLGQTLPAQVTLASLARTEQQLADVVADLDHSRMLRPDAHLVADDLRMNVRMALHACRIGRVILRKRQDDPGERGALAQDLDELLAEYRRVWLARNRSGGLDDSVRVLETLRASYRESGGRGLPAFEPAVGIEPTTC